MCAYPQEKRPRGIRSIGARSSREGPLFSSVRPSFAGTGIGYESMPAAIGPLPTGPPAIDLIRSFRAILAAAYRANGSAGPEPLAGVDPGGENVEPCRSDEDLPFNLGEETRPVAPCVVPFHALPGYGYFSRRAFLRRFPTVHPAAASRSRARRANSRDRVSTIRARVSIERSRRMR